MAKRPVASMQVPDSDRLPPEQLARLRTLLTDCGQKLREGEAVDMKLNELRLMYEPYVQSLASHFQIALPPWIAEESWQDNWQGSFWEQPVTGRKSTHNHRSEHF
jgi:hypothetical protein